MRMHLPSISGVLLSLCVTTAAEPVLQLTDTAETWQLSNGLVEIIVDKDQATITELRTPGGPNLVTLGYTDTNGSPGGFRKNAGYQRFGRHMPATAEVAFDSAEMVDLMFRTDTSRDSDFLHPLWCEMHLVLRRGDPGFYLYWLRWHEEDMQPFHMGQMRHVFKCPRTIFDRWQVSTDLAGVFPTEEERHAAKRVYDATIQLPDGRYMTKYANAVASADHHVSGLFSSDRGVGLWQINPSNEYVNGGPTKRNLTIHEEDPILLHMMQSAHFLGRSVTISGTWQKLYGPVFFYLNTAESLASSWQDAQKRLEVELQRWPYRWVAPQAVTDVYALERGRVTGDVRRLDGKSAEGAYAILGAPAPDWQFQGRSYMYWDRVDADGSYSIIGVQPGIYTLYVWQPGVLGQARVDGIQVMKEVRTAAPEVMLDTKPKGNLQWQIGTPDRTAGEFRHGQDFRKVYLHRQYPEDFPNGVRFVIGESRESRDWNYYQPAETTWEVVFTQADKPTQPAQLIIAVAGSGYRPAARIELGLNGHIVGTVELEEGDSALHRLGNYDTYQSVVVDIPSTAFNAGENTLTLTIPEPRMWVMYDCLRLLTAPAGQL